MGCKGVPIAWILVGWLVGWDGFEERVRGKEKVERVKRKRNCGSRRRVRKERGRKQNRWLDGEMRMRMMCDGVGDCRRYF